MIQPHGPRCWTRLVKRTPNYASAWSGFSTCMSVRKASFSIRHPRDLTPQSTSRSANGPGTAIGPYKLLEQIGEGGFGVVYMAEQQQPVRRKVALKVIKPGMDTRQVIARFEAERQALALMDHRTSPRCWTPAPPTRGRPYFVMELVQGRADHGVLRRESASAARAAGAVRAGLPGGAARAPEGHHPPRHQADERAGDLATTDAGVPKVIDFGVAKATGQQLTDKTLFTQFAQMVGTPLYMSPEQAEMTSIDVDTRSDIYSPGRAALRAADRDDAAGPGAAASRRRSTKCGGSSARRSRRKPMHAAQHDGRAMR